MARQPVDLSAHINETVERGHPADFPIVLKPVFIHGEKGMEEVSNRLAVVRTDTGKTLSVVSDRYRLIEHEQLLSVVQKAIVGLDVGPVPRGIYVDRGGARMRALFKFPALAEAVRGTDAICPCIKLENSYDGTSRITSHIGSFRFVCTNMAVGGGGVFAGGFMSVHAGEIPVEGLAEQLARYLGNFSEIVSTYRYWTEQPLSMELFREMIQELPIRARRAIEERAAGGVTVFDAYNAATYHATHRMRSARSAFDLLAQINRLFQQFYSTN
jgi:Domain of unknown function (DUF932)